MKIATTEPTRYEITARHTDGREMVIGYTPRKSFDGLAAAIAKRADALQGFTGLPANTPFKRQSKPHKAFAGGDWTFGFTGRTQRDVANAQRRAA